MDNQTVKKLYPPATIGMVGGGQLGRMFVYEAKKMGYRVVVLDPQPNSPAGQIADEQIIAAFDDMEGYLELAEKSDVITYEFEHIDASILGQVEQKGYRVTPSSETLKMIQNKYKQKCFLMSIGVKVPAFSLVRDEADLKEKWELMGEKAILKSCTNGYDGKGNLVVEDADALEDAVHFLKKQEVFIEEMVDFVKELSIIFVKDGSGVFFYPVAENIHRNSILIKSLVPASIPESALHRVHSISERVADALDDSGVFCIEFFLDKDFNVMVNEIAPRPHNSGHYTIEGCITSQFEQHVRVACGIPAGSTQLRKACSMHNILGPFDVRGSYRIDGLDGVLETEDCHLHLYGKPVTSHLRKIGHLTALGETIEAADQKAEEAITQIEVRASDLESVNRNKIASQSEGSSDMKWDEMECKKEAAI